MTTVSTTPPINTDHTEQAPARHRDSRALVLCCLLAALTLAVFGKTATYEFVNFDDNYYAYGDPLIERGLSSEGLIQAFAHGSPANWDPLTTVSHMLDNQLFGRHAGGHHLTNVLLHTASVILLFLVLRGMTGAMWPSAFVAAVFAVHPLHVESVAWVSERKDVLSGFFFMLTLGAYVRYVRRPGTGSYLLVAVVFALGLLSKAMLVTLPFVLLLLDYWPLGRFHGSEHKLLVRRLVLEKVPLLAISAVFGVVAMLAQRGAHAVQTLGAISPLLRLENALVSCATYLGQMFWPVNLAVFYPYPENGLPAWQVVVALLMVGGISAAAILRARRQPYLLVGWLWYLIMLAPVIGLIQLGTQARADRYTYLPQIGLYFALAWTVVGAFPGWRQRQTVLAGSAATVIVALGAAAFLQVSCWRNSGELWKRAGEHTARNAVAHYHLAYYYAAKGRVDDAIAQFEQTVAISPGWGGAHNDLANLLLRQGHLDDAMAQYQLGLQVEPGNYSARDNLGNLLAGKGRLNDAIVQLQQAVELQPDNYGARINLGTTYLQAGRADLAAQQFQRAVELQPNLTKTRNELNHLAWLLATTPQDSIRNGKMALPLATQLVNLTGGKSPVYLATLAAAEAETGHFDDAAATAQRALSLATDQGNAGMADALQEQLNAYRSGNPIRDTNLPTLGPGSPKP